MEYANWLVNGLVVAATVVLVLACVVGHYEGLSWLARGLSRKQGPRRPRVLYAVLGAISLHIAEIWLFGLGIWGLLHLPEAGSMVGISSARVLDSVYLSAVTYTTVGFGDVAPLGPIRFLIGTEALVGFVLLTWSASFTYLEMEKNWRER
ncbi:potassium channel family protein [Pseudomarimonas salicorniae]|uniref:Potassium channel family protein n=1 Tax=Pseudomarimonas salicorniae TaxID=2933270 RepID=A0ABT0GC24_9GAMM|nr:potassium channel family protein [Lysobacter sp. CAU 1642]MCK7592090.1 potassium channel family protein [Lysobacter sp. CAU 1642]